MGACHQPSILQFVQRITHCSIFIPYELRQLAIMDDYRAMAV
jgi:hypothetical protein